MTRYKRFEPIGVAGLESRSVAPQRTLSHSLRASRKRDHLEYRLWAGSCQQGGAMVGSDSYCLDQGSTVTLVRVQVVSLVVDLRTPNVNLATSHFRDFK